MTPRNAGRAVSFSQQHNAIVKELVKELANNQAHRLGVLGWASPVPYFGNLEAAEIATLGINPSNREFVGPTGVQLGETLRRLETLGSLRIRMWSEAQDDHIRAIIEACRRYFEVNPYTAWFGQLDNLIRPSSCSYFADFTGKACHLDLIPYATEKKWSHLTSTHQKRLLGVGGMALALMLKASPIRTIIANGRSTLNQVSKITGCEFETREMPDWSLMRNGVRCTKGFSYLGEFDSIQGVKLGRKIRLLGFNHNLQSSFGVTNIVRAAISQWIKEEHK